MKDKEAKIDYSDKGEHKWYWISAFYQKCDKCNIIVDRTFSTPRYHLDVDKRSWKEPACTWKGRAVKL